MFGWFKKKKEELEERKIESTKVVYENGCYSIPINNEESVLYTSCGKKILKTKTENINYWHHGFIRVDYPFSQVDEYIDCNGHCVFGIAGVFCSDEKISDELYVVPGYPNTDIVFLYNHKTNNFVCENLDYIRFNGLRGFDKDEQHFIEGVVTNLEDVNGYGCLNEIRRYDVHYIMDKHGNIVDKWEEDKKDE